MKTQLPTHLPNIPPPHEISNLVSALLITHRVKATLGYNIAYFCILVALFVSSPTVENVSWKITALFIAVFLLKTQASLADVIHDYEVDKQNPEKKVLPEAVDRLGEQNLWTLIAIETTVSMFLWGYLAVRTGELQLLIIGGIGIILGFTYSYPPRTKEWGVLNHVITSGVDVMVVLYPAGLLLAGAAQIELIPVMVMVFLYSFAYHVAHQAADTYYDRQAGISTFTQQTGVENATLLIIAFFLLSMGMAVHYMLLVAAIGLGVAAWWFCYIFIKIADTPEQFQTDYLAQNFNIATWATGLNMLVAANIYLTQVGTLPGTMA